MVVNSGSQDLIVPWVYTDVLASVCVCVHFFLSWQGWLVLLCPQISALLPLPPPETGKVRSPLLHPGPTSNKAGWMPLLFLNPSPSSSPYWESVKTMSVLFFFIMDIACLKTRNFKMKENSHNITEDEMVGWDHPHNEHKSEQTPGNREGQGSLVCCSPRGCKESDTT